MPAARDLFDARHNPVWMLGPSAEMAKKLVSLFRSPNAETPGLRFGQSDTRFLGDLYEQLSEEVSERLARTVEVSSPRCQKSCPVRSPRTEAADATYAGGI